MKEYILRNRMTNETIIIFILSLILLILTANAVMIAGMILGLYVMFTRKMIIVNDYWWKHNGLNQWKER